MSFVCFAGRICAFHILGESLLYKLRLRVLNEVHIYAVGLWEMLCFWSLSRNRVLKSGYLNLCCFELNLSFFVICLLCVSRIYGQSQKLKYLDQGVDFANGQ